MISCDCAIIGAGIGGLTAGVMLAQAGRSVVLFDLQDKPGGCCTAFRRGGFQFDVAVHMVGGIMPELLAALGISLEWRRVAPLYRVIAGGESVDVPPALPELRAALQDRFPAERAGIAALLDLIAHNWAAARAGWYPPPAQAPTVSMLALARYHHKTYAHLLDDFTHDPALRALLSVLCAYGGLPPERLSGLYMLGILGSYLVDGAYFPVGGSQALADALAGAFQAAGGALHLETEVTRLHLGAGGAVTVETDDGGRMMARCLISNADARTTFLRLIGQQALSTSMIERLNRLEVSMSALQVFLGVKGALDLPLETFAIPDPAAERVMSRLAGGDFGAAPLNLTVPTAIDSALAPPQHSAMSVIAAVPAGLSLTWTPAERAERCDQLIETASAVLPDLRGRIVVQERATPLTLERFTRNHAGACYGWAMLPEQMGSGRLSAKTPFPGVFLAGHWTNPGGGIVSVAQSGVRAARHALSWLDQGSTR